MTDSISATSTATRGSGFRIGALCLLLILVILPRFDRNTLFVDQPHRDDVQYRRYVEFFRGGPENGLESASTWRPLVPFLAAFLPARPMTAINLVNTFALLGTLVFLLLILRRSGVDPAGEWLGGLLFVLSFPAFYYSTIGYVDPGGLFFIAMGTWLTIRKKWTAALCCAIVGVLAKESAFVLVAVLSAGAWARGRSRKQVVLLSVTCLLALVVVSAAVREMAPGVRYASIWIPSVDAFADNAARPRAWLSGALTVGIPGLILLVNAIRRKLPTEPATLLPLFWAGLTASVAMWLFAFTSAYVDGRTLWPSVMFSIPLAVLSIKPRSSREGHGSIPVPDQPSVGGMS